MSFFDAIDVAASGLTATRVRMDVTAENLANAQTTRTAAGGPYQRQEVVLQQTGGFGSALAGALGSGMPGALGSGMAGADGSGMAGADGSGMMGATTGMATAITSSSGRAAGGVQVAGIVSDPTPDQLVYDPSSPDANAQGYVRMPNVQPVNEMVDLIDEQNSYQADVTAMQTAKTMYEKTLDLLK